MANKKEKPQQLPNEESDSYRMQKMLAEKSAALELMQREAAIEAALEKVRARTIAMQKSNELSETAYILFQQFKDLGEDPIQITIGIFNEDEKVIKFYITGFDGSGSKIDQAYNMDINEHILLHKIYTAWKEQKKSVVVELAGKELNDWFAYRSRIAGLTETVIFSADDRRFVSVGFFSKGMISFSKPGRIPEEPIKILERFATVFEQTYTRFLDLQNAEAQARESQIQLALERVRARTMAMQKSDELAEVATVLFQQVKALGVSQWTCGFSIFEIDDKEFTWYPGSADGDILPSIKIPLTEHQVFIQFNESRKRGEELYVNEKGGEFQADHYRYMRSLPGGEEMYQNNLKAGLTFPTFQIDHLANFSHGNLVFITYEHFPEMHDVFKRFGKVFEQTYTRFLDLQKAEAQAREAQIQLAMERVRARTMAMQKSDELADAASLLFKQVSDLGIKLWSTAFQIWNADDISTTAWGSAPDGSMQAPFRLPYNEDIFFKQIYEARQSGKDFFVMESSGKELEDTYHYMFNLPGVKKYFDDAQDLGFQVPKYQITHCAFFSNGYLMFITYEPVPEAHDIFKRFAKVFEQTYTRFLDLQKAEAQAREAQIEAALEKVRSRTMAMQRSEELPEAANNLFLQVQALGIPAWSAGYCVWDEDKKGITLWMSSEGVMQPSAHAPCTEDPSFIHMSEAYERGDAFHVEEIGGEALVTHYNYMRTLPVVGEILDSIIAAGHPLPTFQIFHCAYFSQGFLLFITYEPVPETHDIFKRFAKVFEQTYTRFLDLQKAEAQAREAQIEAALERVRSRTMAMHKTDELGDAATVLFNELRKLAGNLWASGFALCDPDKNEDEFWACTESGMHPPMYVPNTGAMSAHKNMYDAWKAGADFYAEEKEGEALKTHYDYMMTLPTVRPAFENILAAGFNFPTWQRWHAAYFKNGYIFIITTEPYPEETIFKRFAKVFEQTYTRFLDLQKAEAQAREGQIETALEKVRSRSLAMHKSTELKEVASTVFRQLKDLNIEMTSASIYLLSEYSTDLNIWIGMESDKDYSTQSIHIPVAGHTVMAELFDAIKSKSFFAKTFNYEEKNKIWNYLFEHSDFKMIPDERKKFILDSEAYTVSIALLKNTGIQLGRYSNKPFSEKENEILQQFSKVFEQAYTRFLDLQKAEAQAREAQIQLALERVRARTMAMYKSEELLEAATLLYSEFRSLNITQYFTCGFVLIDEESHSQFVSITNFDGDIFQNFKLPLTGDPVFQQRYERWKQKDPVFYQEVGGDELKKHLAFAALHFGSKEAEEMVATQFPDPTFFYMGNFSHGYLHIVGDSKLTEEEEALLARFTRVFEMTYKRFLDLQKAEVQAREATIEMALEKVRSRSLAMHKTDELQEVVTVVLERMTDLNIELDTININIYKEGIKELNLWTAAPGHKYAVPFHLPFFNHPFHTDIFTAKENGLDLFTKTYSIEEKNSYFNYTFEHSDFKNIPEAKKKLIMEGPACTRSIAITKNAAIIIIRYSEKTFSESDNEILKRFARVFEQAYTRFLDLKQAEAQAREAQIQLALERVRARTMAMQHSDELLEVASILFQQVKALGVPQWNCGFNIWETGDKEFTYYAGTPDGIISQSPCKIPLTEHPVFKSFDESRRRGDELFVYEKEGDFQRDHYQYMLSLPGVGDLLQSMLDQGFEFPVFQIDHIANFAYGNLIFITYKHFPEMHDVFKRFAKVFEQTYTRFLDLQKSEAQARESQIQLAMERVRARTMAMQKSDELTDVAGLLFEQVSALGIKTWTAGFNVWSEDNNSYVDYITSPQGGFIEPYTVLTDTAEALKDISNARKSGVEFDVQYVEGEKIKQLYRALTKLGEKQFEMMLQDGVRFPSHQYEHFVFGSKVSLMFITYDPVPEAHDIFKRLGKVFEQTYTRFLDLQKAEAQARESQIQLALERVRARTMAMQKSDELAEAAVLLFQQVRTLGIQTYSSGFTVWENNDNELVSWMCNADGSVNPPFRMPAAEIGWHRQQYESWKKKENYIIHDFTGKELQDLFAYLRSFPLLNEAFKTSEAAGVPTPVRQVHNAFNFSHGNLLFITLQPHPETYGIFTRFAKVFEQTYTRFLDLQKAEAQAREAQIEVALERVRSRSLAMHKSTELQEVIDTVFDQILKLGILADVANFIIFNQENRDSNCWIASPTQKISRSWNVPYMDIYPANALIIEKENGNNSFMASCSFEQKNKFFHWAFEHSDFKYFPDDRKEFVLKSKCWTICYAWEKYTGIQISSYSLESFTENNKEILKRFARVFEQSYIRFLDLQKAEAQAREAKIETALERVRSRTMAMQKSEELQDTAYLLFQQIQALDVSIFGCGFNIWDDDRNAATAWMARQDGIAPPFKTSSAEDIFFYIHEAAQRGESLFVREQCGEELETHYRYMATIPIFKEVVEQMAQAGFYLPTFQIMHCAYFTQGYLMFITYEPVPEAYDIFKRFAKVFEQTYTRFLDLQKAEAQAREAQIEGTLESIRSASLAMHHSNQLKTVATVMFKKLIELGLTLSGAFIFLFDRKSRDIRLWIATTTLSEPGEINIPFNQAINNNSIFKDLWNVIENGEEIFNRVYCGKEKNEYFRHVGEHNTFPQEVKDFHQTAIPWITSIAGEKHAALGFDSWDNKLATTEDFQILKRFSKVFEQAYVRFLDLQKAEAQALEAVKRASVDRVRAEIASMRTTNDLERITPLIWRELTTIGVPFIRCGVFIMDEEQQQVHTFLSTPDGKANASFHQPFGTPGEIAAIIKNWRAKQVYRQHWNEAQFIEFTKNLVEQGAVTSGEKYLTENRPTNLDLHFLPFLQGMLYVGNPTPLGDEELQLVQNLADAFSTAYARYDDFNKLESAKVQIEKTLVDLKQAQAQLVQSAKMASLGELTAGIAHEIQNPLNFVNNFSEVNTELIAELKEEMDKGNMEDAKVIANDIADNEQKINHHGKRADAIVKGMLQHSRSSTSAKEPTNINALADEYLRLAYHGLRAKNKSFNATLKTDFDESIGNVNIIPQDIGRVLLNLYNNAFYAAPLPPEGGFSDPAYKHEPTVWVSTKRIDTPSGDGGVLISVRDNGPGIPKKIVDKIFQPFFTTKPTGQGTGLGLSLAYDIVKAHGGELNVETKEGDGSEFTIKLPIA